jgi:hypothetical protein
MYLIYELNTKQVVEIVDLEPITQQDYDYCISSEFETGNEFELTIWINCVDKNKNLVSYSAIRNNPNAKRLLEENKQLKTDVADTIAYSVELDFKVTMLELGLI